VGERADGVLRLLDRLESRRDELVDTIVAETGCPVSGPAIRTQVELPIAQAREFLAFAVGAPSFSYNPAPLERLTSAGRLAVSVLEYEPLGVVSAISAYNYPIFTGLEGVRLSV
jgi:aldehyde dehydrogenase (NAD+)